MLGHVLSSLILKEARQSGFNGTLDSLLETLNSVRLTKRVEYTGKKGKPKLSYQLEEMSNTELDLVKVFNLSDFHHK